MSKAKPDRFCPVCASKMAYWQVNTCSRKCSYLLKKQYIDNNDKDRAQLELNKKIDAAYKIPLSLKIYTKAEIAAVNRERGLI